MTTPVQTTYNYVVTCKGKSIYRADTLFVLVNSPTTLEIKKVPEESCRGINFLYLIFYITQNFYL